MKLRPLLLNLACLLMLTGCGAATDGQSMHEYLDSSAMTSSVKAALLDELGPKAFAVNVKTYKEEVQLTGVVDTMDMKQRAGIVAAGVYDVKQVRNQLVVK